VTANTVSPTNVYECLLLLDSGKVAGEAALSGAVGQIHGALEKHHCEVLASRPWQTDTKLAYPINRQKRGTYYLLMFQTAAANVHGLDQDFGLLGVSNAGPILRYMTTKIEAKWVEPLLAVARDERAMALQTATDDSLDGSGGGRDGGDEGGYGRRGRRGPAEAPAEIAER
jgi:ribosomal protein S6